MALEGEKPQSGLRVRRSFGTNSIAASARAATSSGVSTCWSVWSMTPRPSVLSAGKFLQDANPSRVGRGELHREPLDVHLAERPDNEIVRAFRCVLPIEVRVAKVHAHRHSLETLHGAVHGLYRQLDFVVDVGYAFALAIGGVDQQTQPGIVELDRIYPKSGEATQLLVDDRNARVDKLLACGVRRGRVVGAPHAPTHRVGRRNGDDDLRVRAPSQELGLSRRNWAAGRYPGGHGGILRGRERPCAQRRNEVIREAVYSLGEDLDVALAPPLPVPVGDSSRRPALRSSIRPAPAFGFMVDSLPAWSRAYGGSGVCVSRRTTARVCFDLV